MTGIYELLINAVEHENLGIGFALKTELIRKGIWKEEIVRRLSLPEYSGKVVDIKLAYDDQECRVTITDQGKGFPWQEFIGNPADRSCFHGRGLWIAFNTKFDRIVFNPAGNEVTCVTKHPHPATRPGSFIALSA